MIGFSRTVAPASLRWRNLLLSIALVAFGLAVPMGTRTANASTLAAAASEAGDEIAYVTDVNGTGVGVITPYDLNTRTYEPAINVGPPVEFLFIAPNGTDAIASGYTSAEEVTPLDFSTRTAGSPVATIGVPIDVAFSSDSVTAEIVTSLHQVGGEYTGELYALNMETGAASPPVPLDFDPNGIAISSSGNVAAITQYGSSIVHLINLSTGTQITSLQLPGAYSYYSKVVGDTDWVSTVVETGSDGSDLVPVDLASGTAGTLVHVPENSGYVFDVSPDGTTFYDLVGNDGPGAGIEVVDIATGATHEIPLGGYPNTVTVSRSGAEAYTSDDTTPEVTPINLTTQAVEPDIVFGAYAENIYVVGVAPAPSPPQVTQVLPSAGSTTGGTTVTVTGTGFTGATKVLFGVVPAVRFTVVSDTQITAVAPAQAAAWHNVYVTTTAGTSPAVTADRFTYIPIPAVNSVSPQDGSSAGGTTVTVTGTGFTGATKVLFGVVPAVRFTVVSDTQITAVAPAQTAAWHNVYVTTTAGTSPAVTADRFTYTL